MSDAGGNKVRQIFQNQRTWGLLFIGCVVMAYLWIFFALDAIPLEHDNLVGYDQLLSEHRRVLWGIVDPINAFLGFIIFNGIAFICLLQMAKLRIWLYPLLMLLMVPFCCITGVFSFNYEGRGYYLYDRDEVELGGYVYHLAEGDHIGSFDGFPHFLNLYQCDGNDENCWGRLVRVGQEYGPIERYDNAHFAVDAENNQLQVIWNDEVIFVLSTPIVPN